MVLAPGAERRTRLRAVAFVDRRKVEGIDPSGRVY